MATIKKLVTKYGYNIEVKSERCPPFTVLSTDGEWAQVRYRDGQCGEVLIDGIYAARDYRKVS